MPQKETGVINIAFAGGYEGSASYPVHKHENAWELLYLRNGHIQEISDHELFDLKPGMFILHPPGVFHGDVATGDYFLYHILVTSSSDLEWPRVGTDFEGAPIGTLLGLIVQDWYNGWPQREAFLRHTTTALDILMKRCALQSTETSNARAVVAAARGVMRKDFRDRIDMGELSKGLGVSRSTLYSHFQQVLGRTPQEVLSEIRLRHAVFLLNHSTLPIEIVASEAGFCSSSHLNRKMRRRYPFGATDVRRSRIEHR